MSITSNVVTVTVATTQSTSGGTGTSGILSAQLGASDTTIYITGGLPNTTYWVSFKNTVQATNAGMTTDANGDAYQVFGGNTAGTASAYLSPQSLASGSGAVATVSW